VSEAANAIPGVKEQRGTFNQIIGVTVVIALVVVALFFALLTVERTALYGVLKAIGASTPTLFAGVVLQAVIVTLIAAFGGAVLSYALDALIPPGSIPFDIGIGRIVSSTLFLLVAAIVGCAFSLRRVLRIDPASAIGGSL
jgi:putative ABC transport system permease protein